MAKYWKTTVTVTVLSECDKEPTFNHLGEIADEIEGGDMSGDWSYASVEVDEPTMATLLTEQGSDPEFLIPAPVWGQLPRP